MALDGQAQLEAGGAALELEAGRVDTGSLVTMKTLRDAGLVPKTLKGGVKLLGKGAEDFSLKVDLEVSRVSRGARRQGRPRPSRLGSRAPRAS